MIYHIIYHISYSTQHTQHIFIIPPSSKAASSIMRRCKVYTVYFIQRLASLDSAGA